jgi:hypothetical protein
MNGASGSSSRPGGLKVPGERKTENKETARVHWKALQGFLAQWLDKGKPGGKLVEGRMLMIRNTIVKGDS